MSVLCHCSNIVIESLDEYAVVLARLTLQYTETEVYCSDSLLLEFTGAHKRLHIGSTLTSVGDEKIMYIQREFSSGIWGDDFHHVSSLPLFHSVFYWQAFTSLPLSQIRYVGTAIGSSVGIGGILSYYAAFENLFREKGWIPFFDSEICRYKGETLSRYFRIPEKPKDAAAENTLMIGEITSLAVTYAYDTRRNKIPVSLLRDDFRAELDSFAEELLGNEKVLGILIRGTDYHINQMRGSRRMATVQEMLPEIHRWLNESHYDALFLATEDQDILEQMQANFGSLLRTIPQKRYRISDLKGLHLISDLERQEDDAVNAEKNMIAYFRALYTLSRCRSFMASGYCHGWTVVNSLNGGRFQRAMRFHDGKPSVSEADDLPFVETASLPLIGSGMGGNVYRLNEECVIKVFHCKTDVSSLKQLLKSVHETERSGISVIRPVNVMQTEKGFGAVYEYVDAPCLGDYLHEHSDAIGTYAVRVAELGKQLSSAKLKNGVLRQRAAIKIDVTVLGDILRTRPVSLVPLPFIIILNAVSFICGLQALYV